MTDKQTLAELFATDPLITDDEREIRDTVAAFGRSRLRPHVAEWFEDGSLPVRELAAELGELGVLGMHLDGYGCAGMSATTYGLVCTELEAVDSGLRSFVSVQGSLAMFAIHEFGSEEQKQRVATGHGGRQGDRVLRADRARLRVEPGGHADQREARRR